MLHSWSQVAPMTGPSTRSKLFKEEAGSKYPDWAGSTLVRSTLWGLNTLKIENTSSATPQPASTYDINWKNRRWFSGKLNDWLWLWGQCHWDSDYLEISSRYTNLKILVSKIVASFMSYRIHNLGLPHCQPSRVTTIHCQPFTSNKKTVKGLTCFVVSLT